MILKDSHTSNICWKRRSDRLRLLGREAPHAGSKDESQSISPGFNRSQSIFDAGSGADFDPGLHKFVLENSWAISGLCHAIRQAQWSTEDKSRLPPGSVEAFCRDRLRA